MGNRDDAERDEDGFILRIPYLCPKCGRGFDTKHQRAGHLGGAHNRGPSNPRRTPIVHGTAQGARKHREHGEKPCQECQASWRDYMRDLRARGAQKKKGNYLPPSLERFRKP